MKKYNLKAINDFVFKASETKHIIIIKYVDDEKTMQSKIDAALDVIENKKEKNLTSIFSIDDNFKLSKRGFLLYGLFSDVSDVYSGYKACAYLDGEQVLPFTSFDIAVNIMQYEISPYFIRFDDEIKTASTEGYR